MSKIAFLGLGAMGSRMAKHLIEAGHELSVWNRNASRMEDLVNLGATPASSPSDAAKDAEFVISMVRDNEASKYVWADPNDGALTSMRKDSIAIECSTLSPAWVEALASDCEQRGILFADAPVTGSRPQAEAAQLIFFVGTTEQALDKINTILAPMAGKVFHIGPPTSGAKLKLTVNAFFGIQVAGIAELLSFLQGTGLDNQMAMDIIALTPVCSPVAAASASAMLSKSFEPLFPLALVAKDFSYIENTANGFDIDLPLSKSASNIFQQTIRQGLGEDNITGVAQLYLK